MELVSDMQMLNDFQGVSTNCPILANCDVPTSFVSKAFHHLSEPGDNGKRDYTLCHSV